MRALTFRILCALLIVFAFAPMASAQLSVNTRTVFSIGSINSVITYPLRAYTVVADTLILAHTWRPFSRGIGPVGLAVDPNNKHLFVSYESDGRLDIFDATDATPLGQIHLISPDPQNPVDDIAGMDVHEGRGLLLVVDRREPYIYVFDSNTFAHIETWDKTTGGGAFDVDIIEDLGGQDIVFVTDGSTTVRWYDIDTHAEVGTADQSPYPAIGIGVYMNSNDYPVLLTSKESAGGTYADYLSKYDTETSTATGVDAGATVRGVSVNQQDAYVYVSVGGAAFSAPSVRVYDITDLTELSRANLSAGWSPTDVEATWLAFGSSVKKNSTSHPDGMVNMTEEIVFEITIENRGSRPIHELPLKDLYDTTHLTYLYADAPYTSDDNVDDGEIDWSDLIAQRGSDLDYGDIITVTVHFQAQPEACTDFVEGENVAQQIGAKDDLDQDVEDAAGSFAYRITCVCVVDSDCDDGQYCNGEEICNESHQCESTGNPCPINDAVFCNGIETFECIEATDECGHSGDPCVDDGLFCNGGSVCNEETKACEDEGNPCDEGEECNEQIDICEDAEDPVDDDDDTSDPIEPGGDEEPGEGEVTGGCCGCGG
ncbi:MAG: hypothetical protein M5R36_27915 [Deltaproteobacteria bacterium]|nr:hypothetical protein [Deltaproteobacteria bacterium]